MTTRDAEDENPGRLAPLRWLAQVREQRALAACEARHRARLAAERACREALDKVAGLRREGDAVMASAWDQAQDAGITAQALQAAVQCAAHLAQQAQLAQRAAGEAEAAAAQAAALWGEARAAQAAALRETHKLTRLLGMQAAGQRRALERRALRRDDDERPARPQGKDAPW